MVMIRRPDWEEQDESEEDENGDGDSSGGSSGDGIPPVNCHELQPPLDRVKVRGDILLMRVAETEEVLDGGSGESSNTSGSGSGRGGKNDTDYEKEVMDAQEDDEEREGETTTNTDTGASTTPKEVHVPTNDEFFLDYTKEEYLKFAARTDIVAPEIMEEESSEEEEGEESDEEVEGGNGNADDDEDEDFDPGENGSDEEDYDSEEHQVGMMNMILGHMLRKFREENGRGPDALELLEMRKALADRLGVDVPPVDEEACDWDKKSPSVTPKKHGRKVVVAEEKNETEEIPRRGLLEELNDDEDGEGGLGEEEEEDGSDVEDVTERASLKRPAAEEQANGEDGGDDTTSDRNSKKARLNGENGSSNNEDSVEGGKAES